MPAASSTNNRTSQTATPTARSSATNPRRTSAPRTASSSAAWASLNGISIQPSSNSIPPDRSLTLSTGTAYYIWNARTPSPPYTPSTTQRPSIASDTPLDLHDRISRRESNATSHFPDRKKKGIVIIQHGWSEYARRWMERTDERAQRDRRRRSRFRYEEFYFNGEKIPGRSDPGNDSSEEEEEVVSLGARLRDEGWEIWAMDLWGHGGSPPVMRADGTRRVGLSLRRCVRDLREVVMEAKGRKGTDEKGEEMQEKKVEGLDEDEPKVFLLGHGLGGLVAIGSVLDLGRKVKIPGHPAGCGDVDGVILSAPAIPKVSMWMRIGMSLGAFFNPDSGIWQKKKDLSGLSRLKGQVTAFEQDPFRYDGQVTFQTANSSFKLASKIWRRLDRWERPVFVFHGTDDSWADVDDSRRFVDTIQVQDKKLEEVEGGRHELLRDIGHDRLVRQVVGWLDRRSQEPDTPGNV